LRVDLDQDVAETAENAPEDNKLRNSNNRKVVLANDAVVAVAAAVVGVAIRKVVKVAKEAMVSAVVAAVVAVAVVVVAPTTRRNGFLSPNSDVS